MCIPFITYLYFEYSLIICYYALLENFALKYVIIKVKTRIQHEFIVLDTNSFPYFWLFLKIVS